jgi:hypothetical protein
VSFTDGDRLTTSGYQSSGTTVELSGACGLVRFN